MNRVEPLDYAAPASKRRSPWSLWATLNLVAAAGIVVLPALMNVMAETPAYPYSQRGIGSFVYIASLHLSTVLIAILTTLQVIVAVIRQSPSAFGPQVKVLVIDCLVALLVVWARLQTLR